LRAIVLDSGVDPFDPEQMEFVEDDGMLAAQGTIATSGFGTLLTNLAFRVNGTNPNNFRSFGFSNGTPQDLDGDGDSDIGVSLTPVNTDSLPVGNVFARNAATAPGNLFTLGTGAATVTDVSGAPTLLNFIVATGTAPTLYPFWIEDGAAKNASNAPVQTGSAITIAKAVPEPGVGGAIGLAALAWLRRKA